MQKLIRPSWLWMLPLLLLSVALTASHLNADMIWFDEWFSYGMAGTGPFNTPGDEFLFFEAPDLPSLATTLVIAASDRWPPAYFLLLRAWEIVSNSSLLIDRVLSLFIGLFTLSISYQLGRLLFGEAVGLLTAALMTTSAFFTFYLHELRPYTLFLLFAVLMLWTYCLLQQSQHHEKRWVRWLFGISLVLMLYTHYFSLMFIAALGLYHLFTRLPIFRQSASFEAARWQMTTRIAINAGLAYLPWIIFFIASLRNETSDDRERDILSVLWELFVSIGNGFWWLPLLLLTIIFWRRKANRANFHLLWLWIVMSLVITILVNSIVNFFIYPRYLIPILPAFCILMALGIHRLHQFNSGLAGVTLGLWTMAGLMLIGQGAESPFPSSSSTMQTKTFNTIIYITANCVTPDDYVVVAAGEGHETALRDDVLISYFDEYTHNIAQLDVLVTNSSTAFSWFLPPALQVAETPFEDRIDYITNAGNDIWLFIARQLADQKESLRLFDNLLNDVGYSTNGPFIERADLLSYRYSQSGNTPPCDLQRLLQ